jgi:hypothetical protein
LSNTFRGRHGQDLANLLPVDAALILETTV